MHCYMLMQYKACTKSSFAAILGSDKNPNVHLRKIIGSIPYTCFDMGPSRNDRITLSPLLKLAVGEANIVAPKLQASLICVDEVLHHTKRSSIFSGNGSLL